MTAAVIAAVIGIAAAAVGVAYAWRQRSSDNAGPRIRKGKPLPEFDAVDDDGKPVNSRSLLGRKAVLLFVRGSWCPFCSEQVKELTAHYKAISDLGGELIIVTRRPLDTTRRVADMFDVKFTFWLDENLAAAESLQLVDASGVPDEVAENYGKRTIRPTAIVVDADGIVRYAYRSPSVASRPNPRELVRVLEKLA
jgi:peroxiredoxin